MFTGIKKNIGKSKTANKVNKSPITIKNIRETKPSTLENMAKTNLSSRVECGPTALSIFHGENRVCRRRGIEKAL